MLLHGEYIMVAEKVTGKPKSFIEEWEATKKENEALHCRAAKKIKNMCVFAKNKLTGQ